MGALVQPVVGSDGTLAVLKLQPTTSENAGEAVALRCWQDRGAVTLLDHDPVSGGMLLERLDAARPLTVVRDDMAALQILAEMLARLVEVPAPDEIRRLSDIATAMLDQAPAAAARIPDREARRLVLMSAHAVREVVDECRDRLLHWDLHYDNVLAPLRSSGQDGWRAIDPKPLAGDPGFELLPAIVNRWADVVATGDVAGAVRRRFDLMTDVLGIDRQRATQWTLGRVLQDALWNIADGGRALDPTRAAVARVLLRSSGRTPAW